jgi:hypothetical protein
MTKIEILRDGTVTNSATFETQELADAWLAYHNFSGEIVITDITAELEQARINEEALAFLNSTDYKVLKYRDQVDMGQTPDLTVEEFQFLLTQRQQARNTIKE